MQGGKRPEVVLLAARFRQFVHEPHAALAAKFHQYVDAGEAAAIALAVENSNCLLLVDDAAGRRLAEMHKVRCIGTAGLLLRAKRSGLIESLASDLRALKAHGLFIQDDLVQRLLAAAGESPSVGSD